MRTEQDVYAELLQLESELECKLHDVKTALKVLHEMRGAEKQAPVHPVQKDHPEVSGVSVGEKVPHNAKIPESIKKAMEGQVRQPWVYADKLCRNPECGKQFTPINSRQEFCQKSCNPKAFKKNRNCNRIHPSNRNQGVRTARGNYQPKRIK